MVDALFIDGPQHGRVMRNMAWPGLSVLFPVERDFVRVNYLDDSTLFDWPKTAQYHMWGHIGTTIVYKFEGIR